MKEELRKQLIGYITYYISICPCKGCNRRNVDCHSHCRRYTFWRKGHELKHQLERNLGI